MQFAKMHGIGNDFVIIDARDLQKVPDPGAFARKICDRHFGVGADGLIAMAPSDAFDSEMTVYNSDGTRAEMCGNGLRCAALWLMERRGIASGNVRILTGAGVLTVQKDGDALTADMGRPVLEPARIPVAAATNEVTVTVEGRSLALTCVSMGNPHAVCFDLYPDDALFNWLGPKLEAHPLFPNRTNVEFVRAHDGALSVRVWERGDGETLACGTGACACYVAARSKGLVGKRARVHLPGGTLVIEQAQDDHIHMTGPAQTVYTGQLDADAWI